MAFSVLMRDGPRYPRFAWMVLPFFVHSSETDNEQEQHKISPGASILSQSRNITQRGHSHLGHEKARNNNNNNDIARRSSRFLFAISSLRLEQSLRCRLKCPGRYRVKIKRNASGVFHVQYVVCHVVRRNSSAIRVFFLFFFVFFFAFPSYISGVHHFWVRFLRM